MTNKEIARKFDQLAKLMELHKENPFKIRSYQNTYIQLRKLGTPLSEMSDTEIGGLSGVGKATSAKIRELLDEGKMAKLEEFKEKTPIGIQEMLQIKGLGPKKIIQLWKDLEIESPGELLYACNENRLIILPGFGLKTQDDVRNKINYYLKSRDKFHYAALENEALELIAALKKLLPEAPIEFTGEIRRKNPILSSIEILIGFAPLQPAEFITLGLEVLEDQGQIVKVQTANEKPVTLYFCDPNSFGSKQFRYTGPASFLQSFLDKSTVKEFKNIKQEVDVFKQGGIEYIEPELRDQESILSKKIKSEPLITKEDILGVVHSHSTYSDGLHTLREMAESAKAKGFEYLVISDHSKSAFYANGLKEDRVLQQMKEIDALNIELAPFKIFKSIESDILYDGGLDYEEEILQKFDLIIASVHSNLKMDKEKATARLLAAIENPYTTILGHPTGRLLLSREGYPIDHVAIIDACAKHGVIIELNANPYRLDIDWTWIDYAIQQGVKISINPDAHSIEGMEDIKYGVYAARKGGLTKNMCFNALNRAEIEVFLTNRKKALS